MNRQQRREMLKRDKKTKENYDWIQKLPNDKLKLINEYVNSVLANETEKLTFSLDRCLSAAIVENTNFSYEEIQKIILRISVLLEEDANVMSKNIKECGDLEMAIKKINKQELEVQERIEQLLKESKTIKEITDIVSMDFPLLSKAMVINAVKTVQKRLKSTLTYEEGEKKLLEIIEDTPKIQEIKETDAEFEIIKEIKILDIKGKLQEYHIENNLITVTDGLTFATKEDIENWAVDERSKLAKLMMEITERERETLKVFNKYL